MLDLKALVLSTFPVQNPSYGGAARLYYLYNRLSNFFRINIVSYSMETNIPNYQKKINDNFTLNNFKICDSDNRHLWNSLEQSGLLLHDIFCSYDYMFSDRFLDYVKKEIANVDIVICSHPYLFRLASACCARNRLVIYESLNVEYDAKVSYLKSTSNFGMSVRSLNKTFKIESEAINLSDFTTYVSCLDDERFFQLYNSKMPTHYLPNFIETDIIDYYPRDRRKSCKNQMGFSENEIIVVSLVSAYYANIDALLRLVLALESQHFTGHFIVIGSACSHPDIINLKSMVSFSLHLLGFLDNNTKSLILGSADMALHYMFEGAGTNMKLFDYLASGLPVIANSFGVRGILPTDSIIVHNDTSTLLDIMVSLFEDNDQLEFLGRRNRDYCHKYYTAKTVANKFYGLISKYFAPVQFRSC